jgi:hypothetical protein
LKSILESRMVSQASRRQANEKSCLKYPE